MCKNCYNNNNFPKKKWAKIVILTNQANILLRTNDNFRVKQLKIPPKKQKYLFN